MLSFLNPGLHRAGAFSLLIVLLSTSACGQDRHTGRLDTSDATLGGGEYFDAYPITVEAGEWIEVDLVSDEFDPYLAVTGPSGLNQQNDDYEGSTSRSYLRFRAEESGEWNVYATSYAAGQTGGYRLAINVGDGSQQACADCETPLALASSSDAMRIERGRLDATDATLTSGEYMDEYTVDGRRGEQLVLDLHSTAFDPYLILELTDDEQIDNDDHEGDRTRSLISTTLPADGTYRVLVTSYEVGETGAYDLSIRGGDASGTASDFAAASGMRTEQGTLDMNDATLRSGEYYDTYSFEGVPGQRVRLDLRAEGFDPFLVLQPPRGETIQNDDFEDDLTRSVIEYDLTEPGTYRVHVTSYAAKEEGRYELAMDFRSDYGTPDGQDITRVGNDTVAPLGPRPTSFDVGELTLDQSIRGELTASDRRLTAGEYVDLHVFDGEAGEPVRIEMSSAEFDTYLIVTTPAGEVITNDDFDGNTSLSRIEMIMPIDGRYRIEATSYAAAETGRYNLRISQQDALQPDPPQYDRVAGLFVGISDYAGRLNNLAYTAQDATLVRDALVQGTGMNPQDAIVLTDRQATREAFRNALRDLAARTDENTLFVLFYSGHGGQYPRSGGSQVTDPDGQDESIELVDGEILDDELNTLLGQLRARNQLIVLDACYSGGFAKDVIGQPGRMGLFSSEEDLVSLVASKFEAGGFLSRFFSDALVERAADEDGNGAITPLELSEYLRARYRGDVRNTGLEAIVARETRPGHQHLVVDRGSLGAFSTLFVLR
ncbi:MAG: hypothetical protein HKN04_04665 [Rhodothermaceae bacterium]|nr:hypothetical protein [Rhodothermaceae bacterium]